MAKPAKTSAAALLLLALVAAAALLPPAAASTLAVYPGHGCGGMAKHMQGCGCYDISMYHGGYHFMYKQKDAYFYYKPGCKGSPAMHLWMDKKYCNKIDYKSVKMC